MTDKLPIQIIVVDFAGTLVKAEIIEEANEFRSTVLKRSLPLKAEHAHPESLYKANREFVQQLTGLNEQFSIQYRMNNLERISLSGTDVQNQIATNLFQLGMFVMAKKYRLKIFPEGLIEQLMTIKDKNYRLAIISGVREDIITGMLAIAGVGELFDYVIGQPPILGVSNERNMKELSSKGKITHILGDKLSDLEPGKFFNAKTIFVKWGHASGGEEAFADHTITKPEELSEIILK